MKDGYRCCEADRALGLVARERFGPPHPCTRAASFQPDSRVVHARVHAEPAGRVNRCTESPASTAARAATVSNSARPGVQSMPQALELDRLSDSAHETLGDQDVVRRVLGAGQLCEQNELILAIENDHV